MSSLPPGQPTSPPPQRTLSLDSNTDFWGFQWGEKGGHHQRAGRMRFREPKVDCVILEHHLLYTVEIPGARKEDVQLTLDDDTLQLLAPTHPPSTFPPPQSGQMILTERGGGGEFWWRALTVPRGLEVGEVQAGLEDGVLRVWMPRVAKGVKGGRVKVEWREEA